MTKPNCDKMLSLTACLNRMILPGASVPLSRPSIYNYINELGITVTLKKDGPGNKKAFITECDCDKIWEELRLVHRKAFRNAEKKAKKQEGK